MNAHSTDALLAELVRPTSVAQPWPLWAKLRVPGGVQLGAGLSIVGGYDDVTRLLRNESLEPTSQIPRVSGAAQRSVSGELGVVVASMLPFRTGPEHKQLRKTIPRSWLAAVGEFAEVRAAEAVGRLSSQLNSRAVVDMFRDVAEWVPFNVICDLMQIGQAHRDALKELLERVTCVLDPLAGTSKLLAASRELEGLRVCLQRARAETGPTIGMNPDEEFANLVFLLFAGYETSAALMGSACIELLKDNSMLANAKAHVDEGEILRVVDEFIRYASPLQFSARRVVAATQLASREFIPGETVVLGLGAANHDPGVYAAPDRVDFSRGAAAHIGFGHGIHACWGMHLARVTAASVLTHLIRELPSCELVDARWRFRLLIRGPASVSLRRSSASSPEREVPREVVR